MKKAMLVPLVISLFFVAACEFEDSNVEPPKLEPPKKPIVLSIEEELDMECSDSGYSWECHHRGAQDPEKMDSYREEIQEKDARFRGFCEEEGGKYNCYGFCTESYSRFCDFPFEDAGMACTDDSECQGFCLADDYKCKNDCTGTCATYRLEECDNPTHLIETGVPYFESAICD